MLPVTIYIYTIVISKIIIHTYVYIYIVSFSPVQRSSLTRLLSPTFQYHRNPVSPPVCSDYETFVASLSFFPSSVTH